MERGHRIGPVGGIVCAAFGCPGAGFQLRTVRASSAATDDVQLADFPRGFPANCGGGLHRSDPHLPSSINRTDTFGSSTRVPRRRAGQLLHLFDSTCNGIQTSPYATQVYNDAPDLDSGNYCAVTATEAVTGIDAVLQDGATIQGTVHGPSGRPATGVCTEAYSGIGYFLMGSTVENGNTYTIGNVPADNYVGALHPTHQQDGSGSSIVSP